MARKLGITGVTLGALLGLVPAVALGECCGDCNGDGTVTIDEIITVAHRALSGCQDDGICSQPSGQQRFPASGQTTAYGPGSDGAVRAGAALSYTDNGDGTVTDNNTGLMWEKKDQSGGIHDWSNTYTWSGASLGSTNIMDGTISTTFLAGLNAGVGFAGHMDWRIPNMRELQSIIDYEVLNPTVNAAFNTNCSAGCTVNGIGGPMCSCTPPSSYWSSTTYRPGPSNAWGMDFSNGGVKFSDKSDGYYVRAVRGGL
jgi:hypothetical protein